MLSVYAGPNLPDRRKSTLNAEIVRFTAEL